MSKFEEIETSIKAKQKKTEQKIKSYNEKIKNASILADKNASDAKLRLDSQILGFEKFLEQSTNNTKTAQKIAIEKVENSLDSLIQETQDTLTKIEVETDMALINRKSARFDAISRLLRKFKELDISKKIGLLNIIAQNRINNSLREPIEKILTAPMPDGFDKSKWEKLKFKLGVNYEVAAVMHPVSGKLDSLNSNEQLDILEKLEEYLGFEKTIKRFRSDIFRLLKSDNANVANAAARFLQGIRHLNIPEDNAIADYIENLVLSDLKMLLEIIETDIPSSDIVFMRLVQVLDNMDVDTEIALLSKSLWRYLQDNTEVILSNNLTEANLRDTYVVLGKALKKEGKEKLKNLIEPILKERHLANSKHRVVKRSTEDLLFLLLLSGRPFEEEFVFKIPAKVTNFKIVPELSGILINGQLETKNKTTTFSKALSETDHLDDKYLILLESVEIGQAEYSLATKISDEKIEFVLSPSSWKPL